MLTHKGTQIIKTERLTLRRLLPDDAEMMFTWMSDPEVLKYEDWKVHENVNYTRGFISYLTGDYKSEQTYCWGMQLGEELIGLVMVVNVQEWDGIIAYYLNRSCWSKGYATEAVMAAMDFMFTEVGVERISASYVIQNAASGRVLQKAGMRYRGHIKEYQYYTSKSKWFDSDFYAITKEQYLCSK